MIVNFIMKDDLITKVGHMKINSYDIGKAGI
jgi:hypothetical protein